MKWRRISCEIDDLGDYRQARALYKCGNSLVQISASWVPETSRSEIVARLWREFNNMNLNDIHVRLSGWQVSSAIGCLMRKVDRGEYRKMREEIE